MSINKVSPIWHPMTQHALTDPEIHIDRAKGAYLYTKDGRKIIDAISSWWVITHGHCHSKIADAVKNQADCLEQVIFAGFTHEPAERLAEKLLSITDDALEHVFFSDSGSTSVEVALKMAIGYFEHRKEPKHRIVALEGGYHGDTFGAMAAGSRSIFNKIYEPYLFDVTHLPFPDTGKEQKTLDEFEILLKQGDVAALILEPLVLGADGMQIYTTETLKQLSELCKQYGALLIADEVMTGFGRTGKCFACELAGITPDIMCLSKGVTGGFLPMGVTLCTQDIYMAFYQEDRTKTFFHSTSFTANPLACRAALANLEIWEEEPVLERIAAISKSHANIIERFKVRDDISDIRHIGTILALDVKDTTNGYLSNIGSTLYDFFLKNDILLRPIGNCIYILPPYCISLQDLDLIYNCVEKALDYLHDTDNGNTLI